jgi:C4-dicarboxylate-specific signal transduction histidine kinase
MVGATGTAIAHEISQPLASATNYLHAARRLLQGGGRSNGPVAEALASAEVEAQRARETLERVRDYVSSGRLDLTAVDLDLVARKIATLVDRDAATHGASIQVASSPHLPTILADRIQIEQLLLNLVSNAIEAASDTDGGTAIVAIHIDQQQDRLVIRVEDNGPGIAPEIADRLFEPFETTKGKGMGLGLTLARQIVDAHGGNLRWENLEPCGARFKVELCIDGPHRHDV